MAYLRIRILIALLLDTIDACILGGTRHKEARSSILSCIDDLRSKVNETANDKDFRLITLIQDVGSGKTHLALHIRGLKEISDKTAISYVDLHKSLHVI